MGFQELPSPAVETVGAPLPSPWPWLALNLARLSPFGGVVTPVFPSAGRVPGGLCHAGGAWAVGNQH